MNATTRLTNTGNMVKLCGFKIVNSVPIGEYHGESGDTRDTWGVLVEDYYNKCLPEEMHLIWWEFTTYHNDYGYHGPLSIVTEAASARKAQSYCQQRGINVEIIGLYSSEWESYVGSFICSEELEFLGYDPVGGWSILESIIFGFKLFPEWKTKLNQYGLFKNKMDAHCFAEFYIRNTEPDGWMEEPGTEISILEVYRLVEK